MTTRRLRINRAATVWLIRPFIDPKATFFFVEESEIERIERDHDAISFHAPGARYPKRDGLGRISFQALVEEHVAEDLALQRMARIIRDADGAPQDHAPEPEAAGVRLITVSFPEASTNDDEIVEKSAFLYDALYSGIKRTIKVP